MSDSVMGWSDDIPVHEAVMEAMGAASMCWSNPSGAGVFDPERASAIGEELIALLHRKQIGIGPYPTASDS